MNRLTVGTILGRSLKILGANIIPFVIISAIVHLPTLLLLLGVTTGDVDPDTIGRFDRFERILDLVLANVAAGAMTYGVFMQLRGEKVSILRSLGVGLRRLLPVLGVGILVAILVGLGTLALAVPGMILQCMFYVAVPAAVVEKPGLFGALGRSKDLTYGYKWTIWAASFIMGIAALALFAVVGLLMAKSEIDSVDKYRNFMLAIWGASVIFGAWQSVAMAVTYHELRVTKEGAEVDDLAAVFD